VAVWLDRKATDLLLVVIGGGAHGQKVLPAIKSMGGGEPGPDTHRLAN
jgi:hypothetical protein